MGNLIALGACNLATCVCSSACAGCEKAAKRSALFGRIVYAVVLLLAALVGYLLRNLPQWMDTSGYVSWIPGFQGCTAVNNSTAWVNLVKNVFHTPNVAVPEQLCYGTMSVYRVSFSLTAFHLVLGLIMLNVRYKSDVRNDIQHTWWILKLLILVVAMIGSFFIPNEFYLYYSWIALFGSAIFILIQLILLVDFAHSWTESWVGKYEQTESRFWAVALFGSTVILYLISLVLTILMYVYFTENQGNCWHNSMFITLNIVFCFFISMASIHPKLQEKNSRIGILQSAVVTSYSTYLVWSALSSQPTSMNCSSFPVGQPGNGDGVSLIFGVGFTFLALIYSALRVSTSELSSEDQADAKEQKEKLIATLAPGEDDDSEPTEADKTKKEETDDEKFDIETVEDEGKVSYNYSYFHFTFMLASMYLGMVLTNWQSVSSVTGDGLPQNTILVDQGMSAVWVKMISSWVTLLLYLWTIVAPVLLPNRKFYD